MFSRGSALADGTGTGSSPVGRTGWSSSCTGSGEDGYRLDMSRVVG